MELIEKESQSSLQKLNYSNLEDTNKLKRKYLNLYKKNKELISSLSYAQIIQKGVLPKERHFNRLFNDYFVFYAPQSYISGDFYWIGEEANYTIFAVGDCTGHGVPGALLTMLAQSFLNYIILGKKNTNPSEILKEFDKKFIETFSNENDETYHNDWIDIALCCFGKEKKILHFAGAKRKILVVSNEKSTLYTGSNYPIGGWQLEKIRNFESQTISIKPNDMIYLGSDGFQDQIGGEKNKKFSSKRLHSLLNEIHTLSGIEQKNRLNSTFSAWKTSEQQLDDVCLMGIRL